MTRAERIAALKAAASERILILDGSWGVMIQRCGLAEGDFRGARFANHPIPLKGDNDVLCLTRPDIVALRGDPPGQIGGAYSPRADGYANATELTAGILKLAPFEVSVGVHPQVHPESGTLGRELDVLRAKVDAGATRALSDFFFDIDGFLRFRDAVSAAGIEIPLVPGIMPVSNFAGLVRMSKPMRVPVPDWLANHFDGLDDDPATRRLVAASVAAEMCAKLQEEGFEDFHFYTLNRAELTVAICRVLGVRAETAAPEES